MKKVAVILSGCGVYDGAEIHESVLSMLAIAKAGAEYALFAPDMKQAHVINHISGQEMDEARNVLIESARIARGNIKALSSLEVDEFDALLLPGGFGAAKNLSTWAFEGTEMKVNLELELIVKAFSKACKPIGAVCIAPVVLSKILGDVHLTIGSDKDTAAGIEAFGSTHLNINNVDIVVDGERKVVTGPCYMLDYSIIDIANNTEAVVRNLLDLTA